MLLIATCWPTFSLAQQEFLREHTISCTAFTGLIIYNNANEEQLIDHNRPIEVKTNGLGIKYRGRIKRNFLSVESYVYTFKTNVRGGKNIEDRGDVGMAGLWTHYEVYNIW